MAAETPPGSSGGSPGGVTAFDIALYVLVVLVWGTSWFGMRMQVGVVAPEVSVLWRFALATPLMFAWAALAGQRLVFPLATHGYFVAMAATMFSTNLILFYYASLQIPSGLMAVVFSLASIFNVMLSAIFLGQRIDLQILAAGLVGVVGVGLMFLPGSDFSDVGHKTLSGLLLSSAATLSFCCGNIISARSQRQGMPVLGATAWGMLYGTGLLLALSLARGNALIIEPTFRYLSALIWLAVVASVVAFAAFLTLLGRAGAPRAGYMTILFPVVALGVSTVLEGYQWTLPAVVGLALVIAGNAAVLRAGRR